MKKIVINFIMIVTMICFVGCDKADEENNSPSSTFQNIDEVEESKILVEEILPKETTTQETFIPETSIEESSEQYNILDELGYVSAYTTIIDNLLEQQGNNGIYIPEKAFSTHEKSSQTDERGGIVGLTTGGGELYYLLYDLDLDGTSEFFLGTEMNSKKEIIAVYSYAMEDSSVQLGLYVDYSYGYEGIYIMEGGCLLGAVGDGGSIFIMDKGALYNFSVYRPEDGYHVLDSDILEWKKISEW